MTDTKTVTLAEFLLARIAKDEALALRITIATTGPMMPATNARLSSCSPCPTQTTQTSATSGGRERTGDTCQDS